MKEGKTKSGFEYSIEDEVLDDWELLEDLYEIDNGNGGLVVKVTRKLFTSDQLDALKKHVTKVYGRLSVTGMWTELRDIINNEEGDEKN